MYNPKIKKIKSVWIELINRTCSDIKSVFIEKFTTDRPRKQDIFYVVNILQLHGHVLMFIHYFQYQPTFNNHYHKNMNSTRRHQDIKWREAREKGHKKYQKYVYGFLIVQWGANTACKYDMCTFNVSWKLWTPLVFVER